MRTPLALSSPAFADRPGRPDSTGERRTRCVLLALLLTALPSPAAAQIADDARLKSAYVVTRTIPAAGEQGVSVDQPASVFFSAPIDPATVDSASIFAAVDGMPLAATLSLSLNRRVVRLTFAAPLPHFDEVVLNVDGSLLRTDLGSFVDADGDGTEGGLGQFTFSTALALGQGPGVILGYVYRSDGLPLQGAEITSVYYPSTEGAPPLPVPPAFSDAAGFFQYATVPITGTTSFLVRIRMPGFTESLRRVDLMAGGCWRVADTFLQPVIAPTFVAAATGATLTDATGTVELVIPPGALLQDSTIGLTILESPDFIRDELPPNVIGAGTFVDVAGVFGDETSLPVTVRIPNVHGLPLIDPSTGQPTRVPVGKIDHNTLQWMDMRDTYEGGGSPPDEFLGTVVSLPGGGTAIEFQLDHFCTVCTSYCLSVPTGSTGGADGNGDGDPDCSETDPGFVPDCSVVGRREGVLWEYLDLPGFQELGRERPVRLGYSSTAADHSATLTGFVDYSSIRPIERTIFEYDVEGAQIAAAYDFSQNGAKPHSTFLWDGRNGLDQDLPTGSYPFVVRTKSLNSALRVAVPSVFGGEPVSVFNTLTYPGLTEIRQAPVEGRVVLTNLAGSPYGAGWSFMDEVRLAFDPDGHVVLVQDNGDWRLFEPSGTPYSWTSPPGEVSTLSADPVTGTYVRAWNSGREQVFDAAGRILREEDRYGFQTLYGYTGGLLTSVTTPTGFQVTLVYDGADKLMRIDDSAGRSSHFVVDAAGDLVSFTDAEGNARSFAYDADHRLVQQTRPRGDSTIYTYTAGRISQVDVYDTTAAGNTLLRSRQFGPSVVQTDIAYGVEQGLGNLQNPLPLACAWTDLFTDGGGGTSSLTTDARGHPTREVDAAGGETLHVYGANGAVASRTYPDGSHQEFDYDADGHLVETRTYDALDVLVATTTTEHLGGFGQPSRRVDADGREIVVGYDGAGNATSVQLGGQPWATIEYMSPGFPSLASRITVASGEVLDFAYDAHGNLQTVTEYPDPVGRPAGRSSTFAYDAAGNLTGFVNGELQTTAFAYDDLGRPSSITDGLLRTTSFAYGAKPYLGTVTFHDGSTLVYDYDGLDRLVSRADQVGRSDFYTYDAEGNPTAVVNRNNETVLAEYDALGRLIQKELPDRVTTYAYDARGNLTAAENDVCRLEFDYDVMGRTTQARTYLQTVLPGGGVVPVTHALSYQHDLTGHTTAADDGDLYDVTYAYDAAGQLSTVVQNALGRTWDLVVDPNDRVESISRQGSSVQTLFDYDAASQLTSIAHATTPPVTSTYSQHDAVAALTQGTLQLPSQTIAGTFSYDDARQVESADLGAVFGDSQTGVTYTVGAANRLSTDGEFTYAYDDAGRLTQRDEVGGSSSERFTYDAEGRLRGYEQDVDVLGTPTTVLSVLYAYDPLGRRVERCVNGVSTRFLYDRLNLALELDAQNRAELVYVHTRDLDRPLALHDVAADRTLYYHADRLGSVVALSDDTGAVVQSYAYDEFGALLVESDPTLAQPFGFAGRERDLETGLWFHRARYYDPATGRYLSEDPLDIEGGLNLYAYVGNDPLNTIDPLGLQGTDPSCFEREYRKCVEEARDQIKPLQWMLKIKTYFSPGTKIATGKIREGLTDAGKKFVGRKAKKMAFGASSFADAALTGLQGTLIENKESGACAVHAMAVCMGQD